MDTTTINGHSLYHNGQHIGEYYYIESYMGEGIVLLKQLDGTVLIEGHGLIANKDEGIYRYLPPIGALVAMTMWLFLYNDKMYRCRRCGEMMMNGIYAIRHRKNHATRTGGEEK